MSTQSLNAGSVNPEEIAYFERLAHRWWDAEGLPGFLADCGRLVRPGGVMLVATINRTWVAALIALFGAEVVLRWLPRGTHHYRKLVRPGEIIAGLGDGFRLLDRTGVRVNPLNRRFGYTPWMGVNYMLLLQRRPEAGVPD